MLFLGQKLKADEYNADIAAELNANGWYCKDISDGEYVYQVTSIPQATEKEKAYVEIQQLKSKLMGTDYKALKFSDGALTEEEYAPIRAQRQAWRDQINALETQLGITPINYMEEV